MASAEMPMPDTLNQTDWLGGYIWNRMSNLEPPPSLVKCLGATVAGSMFALLGMVMENIRNRKRKREGISREELGNLIPKRASRAADGDETSRVEGSQAGGAESSASARAEGRSSGNSSTSVRSRIGRTISAPAAAGSRDPTVSPAAGAWSPGGGSWRQRENGKSPPQRKAPVALGACGRALSEVDQAERQIKSCLNKITREKFNTLYCQIRECCTTACKGEADRADIVEVVARETFSKATKQHTFVEMYADLCARLHADLEKEGITVNFKRVLLDQCQQSFKTYLEPPKVDQLLDYDDQYEQLVKYKTQMLGNVKLIGHLLKRAMLSPKIIFHCTDELLSIGTAESLETLCVFLDTIGTTFDSSDWQGRPRLEEVFTRVELLAEDARQSSRVRCILKDLLDKRRSCWREGIGSRTPGRQDRKSVV